MKPEVRKRLKDFVDRADQMLSYSYFKNGDNIAGGRFYWVDGKPVAEFYQPDKEPTDAILFHLRLFVQNKDDISIGRMAELLDDPEISKHWKSRFSQLRRALNAKFELIAAEGPLGTLTNRQHFDMILFGALGHRSERDKNYQLFQKWITDETHWEISYSMFHDMVISIASIVGMIAEACRAELNGEDNMSPKP